MMRLRDGEELLRNKLAPWQKHVRAWRRERESINLFGGALQYGAAGEVQNQPVKGNVQIKILTKAIDCRVQSLVHGAIQFADRFQLRRILQKLRGNPGGSPFQNTARFDRVPDVTDTEFTGGEARSGQGFDQPLVLEFL